jgi:mRNA interferase HigB
VFPKWEPARRAELNEANVRILSRRTLSDFWEKHPETKASPQHWLNVTKLAGWTSTQDVLKTFSKATILNGERVRFEVAGGNYRMIVAFDFRRGVAFIKFIGTHSEYDRIDALTVSRY